MLNTRTRLLELEHDVHFTFLHASVMTKGQFVCTELQTLQHTRAKAEGARFEITATLTQHERCKAVELKSEITMIAEINAC
jgi:hypothetical protein